MAASGLSVRLRGDVSTVRFVLEIAYVATITIFATVGMSVESWRRLIVVAGVLALPAGLGAIVGLYALTGLFNWVASGFTNTYVSRSPGGCNVEGQCRSLGSGTAVGAQGLFFNGSVVLLFLVAATANVVLLRSMDS